MNLHNPIGGYFELELQDLELLHRNAMLLNSARSCFEYVLLALKPRKVFIPKYTCDVILEPLQRTATDYEFYSIDSLLEISEEITLKEDELILYTNYFGVKDSYCNSIVDKYGKGVIIDASQAYYYIPESDAVTFYSPRKYFGVPDGGELVNAPKLEQEFLKDVSLERFEHLIKRIELGPELGYEQFKRDDESLNGEGVKLMSELTEKILRSIDYAGIKAKRNMNFSHLHKSLARLNKLKLDSDSITAPMVYPFVTDNPGMRQKLINKGIYVANYWPNIKDWAGVEEFEYLLADNLIALPIDQRYNIDDMNRILEAIDECTN